jgi:hypothetical protein
MSLFYFQGFCTVGTNHPIMGEIITNPTIIRKPLTTQPKPTAPNNKPIAKRVSQQPAPERLN